MKMDGLYQYYREIVRYRPLSSEEEREAWQRIRQGDSKALDRLIRSNLRFVISIAKNYMFQGVPLVDLVQAGNIGLIRAAEKFDADKNFRFVSYAVWWIRQAILVAIAEQSRSVRLNSTHTIRFIKLGRIWEKLQQRYQREPTTQEISQESGFSENAVMHMFQVLNPAASFDGMHDFYDGKDKSIEEAVTSLEQERILRLLEKLPERERRIIELYFGFQDGYPYTLEEVSKHLDVSRERVRQILTDSLRRLRVWLPQYVSDPR